MGAYSQTEVNLSQYIMRTTLTDLVTAPQTLYVASYMTSAEGTCYSYDIGVATQSFTL